MKKFFALLSALVLSLVIVGLTAPKSVAASDKWTEDPTLAEDEIPMYIMGSIYTTFPNFYDNAAKPDALWGGSVRMYPWNETRLRVAEYDAEGKATGKYYAIFFSGLTTASGSGAGGNVNGFAYNADNELVCVRVKANNGGFSYNVAPMDPSLSHMRINFTGEDITFDPVALLNKSGESNQNLSNRMFVFDGQGRIIRGVSLDGFYTKAGSEGAPVDVWAPMFGYSDGKVVYVTDGVTLDKEKVQQVDAEGNPVFEEDGTTPVMVEGENDAYLYKRFIWTWYAEKPTNVNTAAYLDAGWDCDLYDYVIDSPDGNGYMAIAFVNAEGTNARIRDEERAVTNATREAAGQEALPTTDHYRACVKDLYVPAGGGTYDFGYLDKGVPTETQKFNNIVRGAFLNGRTEKTVEVRTYNFSSTGLKTLDVAANGASYQLMDGKNIIEVMKGATFQPAANINYEGLASTWLVPNDVTSYAKDLNALEYTIYHDGTMVVYKYPYADKAEMVKDFEADLTKWWQGYASADQLATKPALTVNDLYPAGALNYELISTSAKSELFWGNAEIRAKWSWMVNYVKNVRAKSGLTTSYWETIDQGLSASPGTFNCEITNFLLGQHRTAWPASSDYTNSDNANGFLPTKTNQESFKTYEINTTEDHIDKIHTVQFVVKNSAGLTDSVTIKYVVVDGYTPKIKVNENALIIYPQQVDGKYTINPIDPMTLVTAYNSKYNGTILGDDITHNVHFESATLDFDKPTEGTHKVTAKVVNDAKHYAEVTFEVIIADVTAPYVDFYPSLVLPYGTTWDPKLTVKVASDNVEGNLANATFDWCVDESSTPVNTTKPGTYRVSVGVYDSAGNCTATTKAITVVVLEKAATEKDVTAIADSIAAIKSSVDTMGLDVADVLDKAEELAGSQAAGVEAVKAAIAQLPKDQAITKAEFDAALAAAVKDMATTQDVNAVTEQVKAYAEAKGCSKKSAMFFEFLAAGCLLVFVLRRKH